MTQFVDFVLVQLLQPPAPQPGDELRRMPAFDFPKLTIIRDGKEKYFQRQNWIITAEEACKLRMMDVNELNDELCDKIKLVHKLPNEDALVGDDE